MISVFISIGPLDKGQTTIKPQKLLNNAVVWSGEGAMLFYSWKCYILVHFSNHYLCPLARRGHGTRAPSKYALE